jgi:hypothetical protein
MHQMTVRKETDAVFSVEDIDARLGQIGQLDDELFLIEQEDVMKLQHELQHHVADVASDLMTGLHKRSEQREYLQAYGAYKHLLGIVAIDLADKTYAIDGDTGSVKRAVFDYLQESKRQMVAQDYQKRLEKSRLERSKQWLAHHRKTRFVGAFALSGMTSSALFTAGDELTPMIEFSRSQSTGIVGITMLASMIAIRSIMRSGPTKAGAALSKQFNSTLKTYEIGSAGRSLELKKVLEDLPGKYAEKHLAIPFGQAAMYLTNFDMSATRNSETVNQFQQMIDGALEITEQSMYESYGIDWNKLNRKPLLKRMIERRKTNRSNDSVVAAAIDQ